MTQYRRGSRMTKLIDLVLLRPQTEWAWESLSLHVPIDDIIAHPELPWNVEMLSHNATLTLQHVKDNPTLAWNYRVLSGCSNIDYSDILGSPELPWDLPNAKLHYYNHRLHTFDIVLEHPNSEIWNWSWLSTHSKLTMSALRQLRNRPWEWYSVSVNDQISLQDKIDTRHEFPWNWHAITRWGVKYCTAELIAAVFAHSNLDWDWKKLSRFLNLWQIKKLAKPNEIWDWEEVTISGWVSLTDIASNPELPWSWQYIPTKRAVALTELPCERQRTAKNACMIELVSVPAGRFRCLKSGGVAFQQQLERLGELKF